MSTQTLESWKLELIKTIVNDKDVGKGENDAIVVSEVECVINGAYDDNYKDGDTPEEAWEGEKDTLRAEGEN
ncbi:hypothetical protein VLL09_00430 [Dehalococcoides mccartyi]|uniref:Uncharacterized protein n=1 Tax=Dehalococcoides mccartyi TaxID=61435 RepID=A0AB38Z9Y5_9CHLR|nr:hypothetical protein [Dehalococcoides mccartyi]WRO07400.1 hypothetical protein VLL09_00430 [Dehalococcoides mccartyi]